MKQLAFFNFKEYEDLEIEMQKLVNQHTSLKKALWKNGENWNKLNKRSREILKERRLL